MANFDLWCISPHISDVHPKQVFWRSLVFGPERSWNSFLTFVLSAEGTTNVASVICQLFGNCEGALWVFFLHKKMRTHQNTSEHFLNFHLFACVIFKNNFRLSLFLILTQATKVEMQSDSRIILAKFYKVSICLLVYVHFWENILVIRNFSFCLETTVNCL